MHRKIKLKNKVIIYGVLLTIIPLVFSYLYFANNNLKSVDSRIRVKLKEVGFIVSSSHFVKEKLHEGEFDYAVQEYAKDLIKNVTDVDIIVIADMDGRKYSHLDETQLKTVYVNDDNRKVLNYGSSYYSIMAGSMGKTLRWFEPIYYEGQQIGFVMVGKYYKDILYINNTIKLQYGLIFLAVFFITVILSGIFSNLIKKDILGMEPERIARLYIEKKAIIDNVQEGIIALDENNSILEVNKKCSEILKSSSVENVQKRLKKYIDRRTNLQMKEFIIDGVRVFVTINTIKENGRYLGAIIILNEKYSINRVAKEITGVDEIVKNLRANVHEFKNHLHVIMGLLQLNEYDAAREYILKIQKMKEFSVMKYANIKDNYVRSILSGRDIVAKEKKVNFILTEDSNLYEEHGRIDSNDITTILGNLIENALEACAMKGASDSLVMVSILENDKKIIIEVMDNGIPIDPLIKGSIFNIGVSTKGDIRGTGLALVSNRVDLYDGTINIDENDESKTFMVTLYKGE